jgi:hypothetical protein
MNSSRITLPCNDDNVIFSPVNPLGPMTGNVKSGAPPLRVGVGGGGWDSEYAAQMTIIRIMMIAIHPPQPIPFLLVRSSLFLVLDCFDMIGKPERPIPSRLGKLAV